VTSFAARLRSRSLRREIDALAVHYANPVPDSVRVDHQLARLNRAWRDTRLHVPYYADLARRLDLPGEWSSLEQFVDRLPTTGRASLQESRQAMTSTARPPEQWGMTGGSTAKPVQVPRWKSEDDATRANAWLGRSWYGVEPDDRLFLLWGHSHLLGTGARGWINARRREISDRLMGYYRFSAYDISDAAMHAAVAKILAFRPVYIVGYSVALDRLERVAAGYRDRLRELGIKVVIGTSEGFPQPDSAERLADTFGCRVAMEYGAVEAMGLAYTSPAGGYRFFWHSYLAEAERVGASWVLRLTSLYPRSLPLVRYEIGDEVDLGAGAPDRAVGLVGFERLSGRCNDYVAMADGALVHSEVFSHAVRACAAIRGYQVVQNGSDLRLCITTASALSEHDEARLRHRLSIAHPALAAIAVERVDALSLSIAGKTPMIIRRP
jgi:phenylacetate-CoA ligase